MSRPETDYLTEPRQKPGTNSAKPRPSNGAKQGDADAFQVLYDKHKRRVVLLCCGLTANTAEAEDLAQEAFLQLYRRSVRFAGVGVFDLAAPAVVNVVTDAFEEEESSRDFVEEATQGSDEDSPKKDFGADDVGVAGRSTGCSCSGQ